MSGALQIDGIIAVTLLKLVPILTVLGLGGATVAVSRYRTNLRRRRQLERLALALKLPSPAIARAPDGRIGLTLPTCDRFETIENEGGYRGVQPAPVERVDDRAQSWTALTAPVRRVAGIVRVRPTSSRDLSDSLNGFVRAIGDVAFDDAFVIHASSASAAERVLGLEIRRLLLRLPRSEESPRLTVDAGAIRLEWHGEPDATLVQSAASALRRVASVQN